LRGNALAFLGGACAHVVILRERATVQGIVLHAGASMPPGAGPAVALGLYQQLRRASRWVVVRGTGIVAAGARAILPREDKRMDGDGLMA